MLGCIVLNSGVAFSTSLFFGKFALFCLIFKNADGSTRNKHYEILIVEVEDNELADKPKLNPFIFP